MELSNSGTTQILSVVIPAYNVASHIGPCLDSVLRQRAATQALRVIVVVDGATDLTLSAAQKAATGYEKNVRILSQENAGLSMARNKGLSVVETEYVTFLDGDDVWAADYLATILPIIAQGKADLIEYDATRIDERSLPIDLLKIAVAKEGATKAVTRYDFLSIFRCYVWARVYRTSLVRRNPFPAGRRFEDIPTTPWYYWDSRLSLSIGRPLIGYRQRPQSILANPRRQDVDDIAFATAKAASMYLSTRDAYWQYVSHRAFQQACRRITWQPKSTWPESIRTARGAINGVPSPPGFARWLQLHATPIYVVLLYMKRMITRN